MRTGVFIFLLTVAAAVAASSCSPHARAAATQPISSTGLRAPSGFLIETIASIPAARELVALPNGSLLVGTLGRDVYVVPDAEKRALNTRVFATLDDDRAAGIAFSTSRSEIYVATTNHVWVLAYPGKADAPDVRRIADVRAGAIAPETDGDVHMTTSVAYAGGHLYASVGSSCNATVEGGKSPCTEVDPTVALHEEPTEA